MKHENPMYLVGYIIDMLESDCPRTPYAYGFAPVESDTTTINYILLYSFFSCLYVCVPVQYIGHVSPAFCSALPTHEGLLRITCREFDVSEKIFTELRKEDPYRLENIDAFSNILYDSCTLSLFLFLNLFPLSPIYAPFLLWCTLRPFLSLS